MSNKYNGSAEHSGLVWLQPAVFAQCIHHGGMSRYADAILSTAHLDQVMLNEPNIYSDLDLIKKYDRFGAFAVPGADLCLVGSDPKQSNTT